MQAHDRGFELRLQGSAGVRPRWGLVLLVCSSPGVRRDSVLGQWGTWLLLFPAGLCPSPGLLCSLRPLRPRQPRVGSWRGDGFIMRRTRHWPRRCRNQAGLAARTLWRPRADITGGHSPPWSACPRSGAPRTPPTPTRESVVSLASWDPGSGPARRRAHFLPGGPTGSPSLSAEPSGELTRHAAEGGSPRPKAKGVSGLKSFLGEPWLDRPG